MARDLFQPIALFFGRTPVFVIIEPVLDAVCKLYFPRGSRVRNCRGNKLFDRITLHLIELELFRYTHQTALPTAHRMRLIVEFG